MIIEIADIHIIAGKQAEFEPALQKALDTVLSKSKGFHRYAVHKGIESPERYALVIHWETLEDHTVGFRESPAFTEWRDLIGPFFASPPVVEHFNAQMKSAKAERTGGTGGGTGKSGKSTREGKPAGQRAKAEGAKPAGTAGKSAAKTGNKGGNKGGGKGGGKTGGSGGPKAI